MRDGLKVPEFPDGEETFSTDLPAADRSVAGSLPETSSMDMSSASLDSPFIDLAGKAPELLPVGAGVSGDLPSVSLDASMSLRWGDVDVGMPSASADVPLTSVDLPSVGEGLSGDLPSGDDVELTGSHVDAESGGGASLGARLAAGVTAGVVPNAAGLGLSGTADKSEGEVRVCIGVCIQVYVGF